MNNEKLYKLNNKVIIKISDFLTFYKSDFLCLGSRGNEALKYSQVICSISADIGWVLAHDFDVFNGGHCAGHLFWFVPYMLNLALQNGIFLLCQLPISV